MSLINHPNVVKAYCSFVVDVNLWVVMPFLAGGSCLHIMKVSCNISPHSKGAAVVKLEQNARDLKYVLSKMVC